MIQAPLLALLAFRLGLGSGFASAQSGSFTVTDYVESSVAVFPTGVTAGPQTIEGGIPLPCQEGCYPITSAYYQCFINTTQIDGTTIPDEFCNDFFCSQGKYTQLENCLECVIANGEEKPLGYHTNTSLTAAPTRPANGLIPYNPLGLLDQEQANGWIKNVTERCEAAGTAVTGAGSITATPTTTGPYYTSFASGETISLPTWTGLTQYPPPVQTLRIPADVANSQAGSSNTGGGSSGSGDGSPTSSTPAAASSSGGSNGAVPGKKGSAGLGLLGLILAYAFI